MNSLAFRLKRRFQMTMTNFRSDIQFSLRYALLRLADDLGGRAGFAALSNKAYRMREEYIFQYLDNLLSQTLAEYANQKNPGENVENAPIWICWWSGETSAPPLVRKCIESIRLAAGSHPVHLITQDTYSKYLSIPEYMLSKVRRGSMGLAHLSDYIRVSLLAQYGGLWLDATIYCASQIPEEYFSMPIFTCKSEPTETRYVSKMQWTTFVLGGWKGNTFYQCLKAMMEKYWENNATAIDYLFFDYLIALALKNNSFLFELMQQIPNNNPQRDDLQAAMNAAVPASMWDTVLQPETILYKLSWREEYQSISPNGTPSIYQAFIERS